MGERRKEEGERVFREKNENERESERERERRSGCEACWGNFFILARK